MRLRERAKAYATQLCGMAGLNDQPGLNQHVPAFMRDAYEAGFKACAEMAAEIADDCVREITSEDFYMSAINASNRISALVDEAGGE